MNRHLVRAVFLVLPATLVSLASGTTVEERSLRRMVTEAPSIVHGTVVGSASRWTENRSLIVTDVQVEVLEVLKGEAVSRVVVTQPGGTVGKLRVEADGASIFRDGDEVVLFLDRSPRGRTHVIGLSQGRFDVVEDARGAKRVRGLDPEGLNIVRSATAPAGEAPSPAVSGGDLPLGEFLGGVREMVREAIEEGGNR